MTWLLVSRRRISYGALVTHPFRAHSFNPPIDPQSYPLLRSEASWPSNDPQPSALCTQDGFSQGSPIAESEQFRMPRRDPLGRARKRPRPEEWRDDELMTLVEAVVVFWPDGPLTVRSLRTEIKRIIGGRANCRQRFGYSHSSQGNAPAMSRPANPPRLYLRERKGRNPIWVVLDAGDEVSTLRRWRSSGCGEGACALYHAEA